MVGSERLETETLRVSLFPARIQIQVVSMLVSVIMPVYNGMPYLPRSVESVLAQAVELELILLDDGSTDGSFERLSEYEDSRVKLIRNEANLGIFGNLNKGVQLSSGDFVQVFGQDDVMKPGYLASQLEKFQSFPDAGMVYGVPDFIDEHDEPLTYELPSVPEYINSKTYLWLASHYTALPPNISSITIRRRVFDEVGLFAADYRIIGDVEFYNRLSEQFAIICNKQVLHTVRSHGENASSPLKGGPDSLREEMRLEGWYRARWSVEDYKEIRRFRSALRGRFHFGWIRRMAYSGRLREAVAGFIMLSRLYSLRVVLGSALLGYLRSDQRLPLPRLPSPQRFS
jgi:glycosyltransferase involved in cell wall biosynthesis